MSIRDDRSETMTGSIDDAVRRAVAIAALFGVALVHVLQLPDAFTETFYLGLLFTGAIVAAILLSVALTQTSDERVWAATTALPALILLGYLVSRTTGLPGATDDVGEWTEPLGLVSIVVEGLLVCLGAALLAPRWAPRSRPARAAASSGVPYAS
jgi:hypothetical protein